MPGLEAGTTGVILKLTRGDHHHPTSRSLQIEWFMSSVFQRHVVETYFGFDEESVDSETSSLTSYNTDHTPATPEEDLEDVSRDLLH